MKKKVKEIALITGVAMLTAIGTKAQTVSTFENLALPGTYWDGAMAPAKREFRNSTIIFPNHYDTAYGGYWASGWAFSNIVDSTTAGYTNIYATRAGGGYAGTKKYLIGKNNALIKFDSTALSKPVSGCYISNSTYAALSMKNGDSFAKKFGGSTGNDADWFKLTVRKYLNGVLAPDSIEFYLADYRFADNSKDYILNTWQWLNLASLGNVDSLKFMLSSSDVGAFGMNTPAYFCMDNFIYQEVLSFEKLFLPGKFYNGAAKPLGTTFADGNATFNNHYDTAYGGYWAKGWAYSNIIDTTTTGYTNIYGVRAGTGYAGSNNYLVGKNDALIQLKGAALGKVVQGLYISNSTYAALSMKSGDSFAKKFGGSTGNDADWFKLTVRKYLNGVLANDSVEFYLADYRFADNSKDYIVNNWQWLDLKSLGNVDSLKFMLSSSDVGAFGMNTPAYFCIDDFTTSDIYLALNATINNTAAAIVLFPNPATTNISITQSITQPSVLSIINAIGQTIYSEKLYASTVEIAIETLPKGLYYVSISNADGLITKPFIKQ